MNINVNDLAEGFSKNVELESEICLPNPSIYNEKSFIKGTGIITNTYGNYTFSVKVSATVSLNCSSCLEEFKQQINFEMTEIFSKLKSNDGEMFYFSSKDNIIHLQDAIITNLLINLPMKIVCTSACKGLCHKCGHILNESDCGCPKGNVDPRFEKILQEFKNKE